MQKIDSGLRQAVFDLIYYGVGGQMHDGDTFGIWTYNDQPHTGQFPMQIWNTNDAVALATVATKFIQSQEYDGQSVPMLALAKVGSIVRNVKDVNVIFINDGSVSSRGTPFDSAINSAYNARARARKEAKQPFLTTFIAREGGITNALVALPGEPIAVPPVSPRPALAAQPKPTTIKTNVGTNTLARAVTNRPAPTRRVAALPFVIKNSTNTSSSTGTVVTTRPDAAAPAAPTLGSYDSADRIGSNEALAEPAPWSITNTAKSNAAPAVVKALTQPAAAVAQPEKPETPKPSANPPALTQLLAATPVAARSVPISEAVQTPASRATPFGPITLVAIGALLLAGAGFLLVFGIRKIRANTPEPSLISRSMEGRS
jgi:hypothetical protein